MNQSDQIAAFVDNAKHISRIISNWLPVIGDAEQKSANWKTQFNWFCKIGQHYTECERIRNPDRLPFGCRGSVGLLPQLDPLNAALDAIAVAYGFQPVSDDSGIPHWPYGEPICAIEPDVLRAIDAACKTQRP